MTAQFVVAMIADERDSLPKWVTERLDAVPGLEVRYKRCTTEDQLLAIAKDADFIWTRAQNLVLTPEVLPKLSKCKAIFRSGSGMDGYPIEEAAQLGMHMCNCPESISESVAEHAVALLLDTARQVTASDRFMRGETTNRPRFNWHVTGRTLGLVGFGRIARRVVELLAGFKLKVLCYDPFASPEDMKAMGVTTTELDSLLSQADFVSLHCPLTDRTRHLIGKRELALMKPNAILVNTSRGPVIDEPALLEALRNGTIGGAALDVTDPVPPIKGGPIFDVPNLVLTPHSAAMSADFQRNFFEASIQVILDAMAGKLESHSINKHLMLNAESFIMHVTWFLSTKV